MCSSGFNSLCTWGLMSRWVKSGFGEFRTLSLSKSDCFHGNFTLTNENKLRSVLVSAEGCRFEHQHRQTWKLVVSRGSYQNSFRGTLDQGNEPTNAHIEALPVCTLPMALKRVEAVKKTSRVNVRVCCVMELGLGKWLGLGLQLNCVIELEFGNQFSDRNLWLRRK